jgi:hypothetical protein
MKILSHLIAALVFRQRVAVHAAIVDRLDSRLIYREPIQRALSLTNDELAQVALCKAAVDNFTLADAELNQTIDSMEEYWQSDLSGCFNILSSNPVDGITCKLDALAYETGTVYNSVLAACADAGGLLVLTNAVVNCSFSLGAANVTLDMEISNLPRCGISQDEEPSCDLEWYRQYFEETFESMDRGKCTANATLIMPSDSQTATPSPAVGNGTTDGDNSTGGQDSSTGVSMGSLLRCSFCRISLVFVSIFAFIVV